MQFFIFDYNPKLFLGQNKKFNFKKKKSNPKILPLEVKHKQYTNKCWTRTRKHFQVKSKSARSSGSIARRVDLIEELVLNDLRHQAMNCLYGCLAARRNHNENGD